MSSTGPVLLDPPGWPVHCQFLRFIRVVDYEYSTVHTVYSTCCWVHTGSPPFAPFSHIINQYEGYCTFHRFKTRHRTFKNSWSTDAFVVNLCVVCRMSTTTKTAVFTRYYQTRPDPNTHQPGCCKRCFEVLAKLLCFDNWKLASTASF